MPYVVGVTFRRVGKVYYFDPGEIELREGDFVIAETARGVEFGEVVLEPRQISDEELVAPLKKIVRRATGDDLEREADNREKEQHAFEVCERKIAEHKLSMKLIEAEYAFDGSQVTFSFSADGRVDFRELVKDVSTTLRAKIQLHQIGVRDEAKLVGGYGTCGRPLCCATFLSNFEPISMKMAKDQSLFLNPAKFSGACGKLMCCLRYEHDFYKGAQRRLPAVGAIVPLEGRRAKVIDVNVISNTLTVQTEEDVQLHIPASHINLEGLCRKHGIGCNMSESNCQPLVASEEVAELSGAEEDEDLVDDEIGPDLLEAEDAEPHVISRPAASEQQLPGVSKWRKPGEQAGETGDAPVQSQNDGAKRRRSRGGRNGGARRKQSRPRTDGSQ